MYSPQQFTLVMAAGERGHRCAILGAGVAGLAAIKHCLEEGITPFCFEQLDDIGTWWRHQMETFSALMAICAGKSPVTGEFTAQRPVTRSFDFSLICVWINGWVNNGEAGDLRR